MRSDQIRKNSRLIYLGTHIPKPQPLSNGRTGNRAYVFAREKVDGNMLESVSASTGFYRRLEKKVFR